MSASSLNEPSGMGAIRHLTMSVLTIVPNAVVIAVEEREGMLH